MQAVSMEEGVRRVLQLAERRDGNKPRFIAIDGHSAAGKSTFARRLFAAHPGAGLILMDDFYRPMEEELRSSLDPREGYRRYYDWQRLRREVLEPLARRETAEYPVYDWDENRLGRLQRNEPAELVIVEGCYSARPELAEFSDVVVLVETGSKERAIRQERRDDAPQGWLDRWEAAERYYIETTNLRLRADLIVSGM